MIKYFLVLSVLACNLCFSERYIQPTKYEDQEEILIKGGSIILSNKVNPVLMFQTSETLKNRRGNFYFEVFNNLERPTNLYFSNLHVTDQWGRPVRVVPKKELINNKKRSKNLNLFFSAISGVCDAINADSAGTVNYRSQTFEKSGSRFNVYDSKGRSSGYLSGYSSSTTNATIQVEALRRQAYRQAEQDLFWRDHAIERNYEFWEYGLKNFYFDSTTIFPQQSYSANIQIEVDKKIEQDLQYLLFTFSIGEEEHTFCFYCGIEKRKGR